MGVKRKSTGKAPASSPPPPPPAAAAAAASSTAVDTEQSERETKRKSPRKKAPAAREKSESPAVAAGDARLAEAGGASGQAKAEASEDAAEEGYDDEPSKKKQKKAAKPKKPKEPVKPLDPSLPINTTVDPDLKPYAPPANSESVRIVSWNVCGLKASEKKGFKTYVAAEPADILCLQETRCDEPNMEELTSRYPHRYWGVDAKKNYAGVAVLSTLEPKSVTFGFPEDGDAQDDAKGRIITLEFDNTYVINTYVRNAGESLKNMDLKEAWNASFEKHVRALETKGKKPIVWTGDLNCVPTDKDIRNWKTNYNKSAGCTQIEIDGLMRQMNPPEGSGHERLVDAWRELHPDLEGHYTYYSYRFSCRTKGIGWRLDSFIVSEQLLSKVNQCEIRHEIWGASDHVPIYLDIKGPL